MIMMMILNDMHWFTFTWFTNNALHKQLVDDKMPPRDLLIKTNLKENDI